MKTILQTHRRTLSLVAVLLVLVGLLVYVMFNAGPLAPIKVTVVSVDAHAIEPKLFGIGTVEARFTHKVGPTFASRIHRIDVQPGDVVTKGQLLVDLDPIDMDDKIRSHNFLIRKVQATVSAATAQAQEVGAKVTLAQSQVRRYDLLLEGRLTSEEVAETKRAELKLAQASLLTANANLESARAELARAQTDRDGLAHQRANLRLTSPVDGRVTRREADVGTTVVAGQTVVEVVHPNSLWVNARFDQQHAAGLIAKSPAQIVLRARSGEAWMGQVERIEPHADSVTEEIMAKITWSQQAGPLPAIGELAEVTVNLARQPAMPVIPNASIQRVKGQIGVWVIDTDGLRFAPIKTGFGDLDGRVQVLHGLSDQEKIVVYSEKVLNSQSRIKVVDRIVSESP